MVRPPARRGAPAPARTGILSLFQTDYSPAGAGHVALVRIAAASSRPGFDAICGDNDELTAYLTGLFLDKVDYYDAALPRRRARFARLGDLREAPAWEIRAAGRRVAARWYVDTPPVVAHGGFRTGTFHLTTLFFTELAEIELDGRRVPGRPFPRDIWRPSIGSDRSSCCFALGEAFVRR